MDTEIRKAPGRNDPCPCGSGKKYKNCHLDKDEAAARAARAKALAEEKAAPAPEGGAPAAAGGQALPRGKGHGGAQPWKRSGANTRGFQRVNATRKVGSG